MDISAQMKSFNVTNLVKEIQKNVPVDRKKLIKEVKDYIWPRLDFLRSHRSRTHCRFYIFEDSYVETEWKDMISIHYINTSYRVKNTVMRVHVFNRNVFDEKYYLGCFTLRNIDETKIMLSYIYPNWKNLVWRNQKLHIMTYLKKPILVGNVLIFLHILFWYKII